MPYVGKLGAVQNVAVLSLPGGVGLQKSVDCGSWFKTVTVALVGEPNVAPDCGELNVTVKVCEPDVSC